MQQPHEVATSPDSRALFAAWQLAASGPPGVRSARRQLTRTPEPGAVALRCRYRHLLDPAAAPVPRGETPSWDRWCEITRIETEGDLALVRAPSNAAAVFERLRALEDSATLRIVTVNALQGLGDTARQHDQHEAAAQLLTAAIDLAANDGYRFGEVRALVSLGYLTMAVSSAHEALDFFERALQVAEAIPDALFAANAGLGAAEATLRLGRPGQARDRAAAAYRAFDTLGSHMGAGNAAERLASAHRALDQPGEVVSALTLAQGHFRQAGSTVGQVNALDGLGEAALAAGHHDEAAGHFTAARDLAGPAYERGRLNAVQGLARAARARHQWQVAADHHRSALDGFDALGDLVGQMHAFDGLAICAGHLDGAAEELRVRLQSVQALERLRASRNDHSVQLEYRRRFTGIYQAAMRSALAQHDPDAATYLLECLAGRRLAGLLDSLPATGTDAAELTAHLTAMADQRLAGRLADPQSRTERVARLLGATAIRHAVADQARDALDDLAASLFLPLDPSEASGLLAAAPDGMHVLVVAADATTPGELCHVWRDASGETHLGSVALPAATLDTMNRYVTGTSGYPGIGDLAPLRHLVPDRLRAELAASTPQAPVRLLLIPLGGLWLLPWPALLLDDHRVLGEVAELSLCPSLTVAKALRERPRANAEHAAASRTAVWHNPTLTEHRYRLDSALGCAPLPIADAAGARRALLAAPSGPVVIVGHGRPVDGSAYLELAPGEIVTTAELLASKPAARLALICCWGAADRSSVTADPLTLAVTALIAGSREVLATVGELADSPQATFFVQRILASRTTSLPSAVTQATRALLAGPGMREAPVAHWAPIITLAAGGT
ncbi:MAG: CHAT domain-containing protein [Kineosporiaceae bacterium]|nr:CHAT domain-containing protein [Kineosporiaceae bacterium]